MYAVMGITGNVGGAVARTLLAKGEKVRGIVRNPEKAVQWQKQGAELFKADYDDVDALTAAFTGVAGVFVMVPPNFAPAPGFAEIRLLLKFSVLQQCGHKDSHCCAPGPTNTRSGVNGPTGMYWLSTNCPFASGRSSRIARASFTDFASTRKMTPLPSPREYHSRILPSR
jgi:hypothetical protein